MLVRWMTKLAAAVAAPVIRAAFRRRWEAALQALSILLARGEFPLTGRWRVRDECRRMLVDALQSRLGDQRHGRMLRGPAAACLAPVAVIALTAVVSRGFHATRAIAAMALDEAHFGTFLTYAIPIVFAFVAGLVMAISRGPGLNRFGWRYGLFFFAKTALVLAAVPLLWIELNPVLRWLRPPGELSLLLTAVLSRFAFILAFVWSLGWCFDDQRRRCPVCLRRLSMPVRIGSWSSVFDPVTTEVMCEDGHGTLELGAPDRWVKLDESWQELFEPHKV